MIRLSRLTDYAIVLLSYMGKDEGKGLWAASELAEKSSLPMPTVAKVLKLLAKSNLVSAQRGAMGGYRLVQPARKVMVADIIEAMDGPISITDCADGSTEDQSCKLSGICCMSNGWKKVNTALRQALQNISLAEMEVLPLPFPIKEREARLAEGQ